MELASFQMIHRASRNIAEWCNSMNPKKIVAHHVQEWFLLPFGFETVSQTTVSTFQ